MGLAETSLSAVEKKKEHLYRRLSRGATYISVVEVYDSIQLESFYTARNKSLFHGH